MDPTLVIMAAGIGSRYGGLKQVEPVGPHGEVILDYSVYDALQAGFARIVFIISRRCETDFRSLVGRRFENHVQTDYLFQEIDSLPRPFRAPAKRDKPWGTGHAVLVCEDTVHEPFCAINADDFYGRDSYRSMADYLREAGGGDGRRHDRARFAMVSFRIANTLSDHGPVARGICNTDANGDLIDVVEQTRIERAPDGIRFATEDDTWEALSGAEPASMNFWGFTPAVFSPLRSLFVHFLEHHAADTAAEFFLPTMIDRMIKDGIARVRVLNTEARWYGVTYPDDKAVLVDAIQKLIDTGAYPAKLWS